MEKIKRFFECLLPVTLCNLECPYCYIIQGNLREMELAKMKYPPKCIAKGLRKERVGGTCYISICGAGETLIQPEAVEIVSLLLKEGHYVNITTNGTQTRRFKQLVNECGDMMNRLHIAFSFHYVELKKRNLLDTYFENIKLVKDAGASFLVQFNLCDEYMPYLDEMKEICIEKVGALPQVALTRDEHSRPMKIMTSLSDEEYFDVGGHSIRDYLISLLKILMLNVKSFVMQVNGPACSICKQAF